MLSGLKANSMSAVAASKLSDERADAMDFYLGNMDKAMPVPEGRSRAVSSDVADCVEGLMPDLMEIFAGSDEVVVFNPVGPEDIEAAEQETEYVNHVFMQQNPGFLVLYSFIKDALLSKVGVVKAWWEEREEEQNETYFGLTPDELAVLSDDHEVEIVEHSENENGLHDVKVTKRQTIGEAKIMGVPPEEFGIEPNARSIRSSNYCYHKVFKTEGELLAQGFDEDQVKSLPTYTAITNTEETSRSSVAEDQEKGSDETNKSARQIEVTEHYVRMDYKGDGATCLYQVTTAGEGEEILVKDGEPAIVEWDEMPFAAMSPVIVTHRFFGRSIADLVMDIQKIKTSLLRALLDNAYLANNPRVEVAESFANENTLDDLLVSRQGGIVRTKNPGGLQWQSVPTIGNHVFPLLEYEDQQREMRTGVTKQGMGIDAEVLQNQSATAVSHVFTMAQAKMRLIARIFAETGVKDLFVLLHGVIRRHGSVPQTVRLRNNWVTIDPRQWRKRADMTCTVGLGASGRQQAMAQATTLITFQEKALAGGLTNLVTPSHLYNSAKLLCKAIGEKDCTRYFADPATMPPLQPQIDPKVMEIQMKSQLEQQKMQQSAMLEREKLERQALVEQQQAAADIAVDQKKAEHEMTLAQQKFELERELKLIDVAMKREQHQQSMQHDIVKHESSMQQAQAKQQNESTKAAVQIHSANLKADENVMSPIKDAVSQFGDQMNKLSDSQAQILKHLTAKKKAVRGKDGSITIEVS